MQPRQKMDVIWFNRHEVLSDEGRPGYRIYLKEKEKSTRLLQHVMKTLLAGLLMIIGAMGIHAQERILTEREYTEICTRGEKNLSAGSQGPFRMTVKTDIINEGRPEMDYTLRSSTTFLPGQGSHSIDERTIGGKPSKGESISLGGRAFSRGPDGQWKEIFRKPATASAPAPAPAPSADTKQQLELHQEFKYLGIETFGDRKVHVYSKLERAQTFYPARGMTSNSENTTKVRVGTEGNYYRFESNVTTITGDRRAQIKIVTEAFADPTITITIPETAN